MLGTVGHVTLKCILQSVRNRRTQREQVSKNPLGAPNFVQMVGRVGCLIKTTLIKKLWILGIFPQLALCGVQCGIV